MLESVRTVNAFFKTATMSAVKNLRSELLLTDRQNEIFERYYIKGQDVNFIADTLYICPRVVTKELGLIRQKILVLI